ncbi:metal-dependent transcriptional regulator, partial [candidate division KSB1 bacterium]
MHRNIAISEAAEDCLLFIYRMNERAEIPTTSALSQQLGVTDSTVTAMLQRLSGLQLINYQSRKGVSLTESGRYLALQLARRHRLVETYLWVHLGYQLSELHAEADRLEHAVSEKFIEEIDRQLGHPEVDPHGEPIPDAKGGIVQREQHSLMKTAAGQRLRLSRFLDTRPEALSYLESLTLFVGARL